MLVNEELNMTLLQCVLEPRTPPCAGLHQKERDQQVKGGDPAPLLCSGETPLAALCAVLVSSAYEGHGAVGASPEEATRMLRGWSTSCMEMG